MANLSWVIFILATISLSYADKCSKRIPSFAPFAPYAMNGSNESVPDELCCRGLADIVDKSPDCVSAVLDSVANFDVHMTRAIGLPKACSLELPEDCKAFPKPSQLLPLSSPAPAPSSEAICSAGIPVSFIVLLVGLVVNASS